MSRGIDYSGPGSGVNRDPETGIRYGIIGVHDLSHWALDDFEADYGDPHCGHCGGDVVDYDNDVHDEYDHTSCADYACEHCEKVFESGECYGDEARGHILNDEEYQCQLDSSNDVWVFKSPYYTRAGFCSPCAPGACHLSSPCDDGEKVFCLGHDFFENRVAPYPVYSVATGESVLPDADVLRAYPHNDMTKGK